MTKQNKNYLIILSAIVLFDVVIIFVFQLYPAAIVGTSFISNSLWNLNAKIIKNLNPNLSEQQLSDQLIKAAKEWQLVNNLKINYDSSIFGDELKYDTQDKLPEYDNILKNYFFSDPNLFREFVIKPQVYDVLLRIKYNSDFIANDAAYKRAAALLIQLDNGKTFEKLAKSESDDKASGQLGGDLGFVTQGQILPELEQAVMNSTIGEVNRQIVISRFGYHIIYPVETGDKDGEKVWHVKQIFIQTSGYDNWLNSKLGGIFVWRIK